MMVTATEQPIACGKCGKTIATWDGNCIVMDRRGRLSSFPVRQATIQCDRSVMNSRGAWVPCGHVNEVNLSGA